MLKRWGAVSFRELRSYCEEKYKHMCTDALLIFCCAASVAMTGSLYVISQILRSGSELLLGQEDSVPPVAVLERHKWETNSMVWHADMFECRLGVSLKPTWVLASLSHASCLLSTVKVSLRDPQEAAEAPLSNSFLHTYALTSTHIV